MSNYLWLLDAGHGGVTKDGMYTTAPGKMHVFDDGLTVYEGVNNRKIVDKLRCLLVLNNIEHRIVNDPVRDTPLKERVAIANQIHSTNENCIYLSVHSDAMPDGAHGKGSGFSIYTSKGATKSDVIVQIFCSVYRRELPQFKFREDWADGDADKEENFYVLRETHCPALLVENLFFDNRKEAEFLLSEWGQTQIAMTLLNAILTIENQKPL
jgi:N-acetylmuramoyl-L-alanine amidase